MLAQFDPGRATSFPAAGRAGARPPSKIRGVTDLISPQDRRRAFHLGIANGILFGLGVALADPTTMLPVFLSTLTSSQAVIGLLSTLTIAGWLVPQLIAANYMQHRPLKMPLYRGTMIVRNASWLFMLPATFLLAERAPGAAVALFLVGYAMFTMGGGACSIAFFDIVAKTVPANRIGSFFGARLIGGGLLAIPAGLLVRYLLGPAGPTYPANYGISFLLAGIVCSVALVLFTFIHEPPGESPAEREPLLRYLAAAPSLFVADLNFRRVFTTSLLFGAAGMVAPFYVIYARRALDLPGSMVGLYLSVQLVGSVLSSLLWAPFGDRRSGRAVLVANSLVVAVVPLAALVISLAGLPAAAGRLALCAVFFMLGVSSAGGNISFTKYLIELAPALDRPRYAGVFNTFSAAVAAFPVLAGLVIDHWSFQPAFSLAVLFGLLGVGSAVRLGDPGKGVEQ